MSHEKSKPGMGVSTLHSNLHAHIQCELGLKQNVTAKDYQTAL